LALTGVSAILIAGVFLIHFKAAAYLLPLLGVICIYELALAFKKKGQWVRTLLSIAAIGIVSIVLILPALVPAMDFYVDRRSTPAQSSAPETEDNLVDNKYSISTSVHSTALERVSGWSG